MTQSSPRDASDLRASAPSRRSVVRAGAWTVPVVASAAAAPAFAASQCSTDYTYGLDWGSTTSAFTRNTSNNTATATATATGGQPMVISFASTYIGGSPNGYTFDATYNLTVPGPSGGGVAPNVTNLGALGTAERGLCLQHSASATTSTDGTGLPARGQRLTITFPRAVTSLSFHVVDIDATNGYWDQIRFTNAVPSLSSRSTNVTGNGFGTSPLQYGTTTQATNSNISENTSDALVKVTFAGPTSTVVMEYWNKNVVSGTTIQRVFLSDFSFTARGC